MALGSWLVRSKPFAQEGNLESKISCVGVVLMLRLR